MSRLLWTWATVFLLGLAISRPAEAAPNSKRRVAVLEYRSDSAELRGAAERVAKILRKKTSLAILDLDDARQRYGSRLDGGVAECAGKPECIANIGKKLGVGEVLLIGVSQFGEVIVTMQRIDTDRGKVLSRVAEAMAPGTDPDDDTLLAYVRRVMPKSDFRRYGTIRIAANIAGAAVLVDDKMRGQTPLAKPIRVRAPASYVIRLTRDGYVPFRASVAVPPEGRVEVNPVLELEQDAEPLYRRWWVWTIAGSVVAGTIAVIALAGSSGNNVTATLPEVPGQSF